MCKSAYDEETGLPCAWCKSGAVKDDCLPSDLAKSLPPGVFDCSSRAYDNAEEAAPQPRLHSFDYVDGLKHTLRDGDVDSSLCDASSPKQFSGYMSVEGSKYDEDGQSKHYFYWFFEKRAKSLLEETPSEKDVDPETIPFVIWLTGGPGCSSTLALLTENGPCTPTKDGHSTIQNPYSWTEAAHVLWLDQPSGVGYSYGTSDDTNEEMIGEDAYYFIQSFLKAHPEYKENPLYIVGESYGGHFAPAIAHRVHMGNKKLAASEESHLNKINLQGVGIGNGLTNPEEQYKYYAEMAYNNPHGIKAVSEETYEMMKKAISTCTTLIHQCNKGDNFLDNFACQSAFLVCNDSQNAPYRMSQLNPYDITKKCPLSTPLCYDFSRVENFLNLESTRNALHVSDKAPKKWASCNFGVNMKFHVDWMKDFSGYVADMLNDGIPYVIYAGDLDFVCNYMGNKAWTEALEWAHKKEFNEAEEHDWDSNKGLMKSAGGLTFIQVYEAGHMVPSDQPEAALDLIKQFTAGDI